MLKIYHTPGSRSVRPIWLCFELDIPAQIKRVDASYRGTSEWRAISPTGKVPAIEDGDITICESGAILDYLLARYGEGRLQPAIGSPQWAEYRQWFWFAEATLIRPVGLYRLLRARKDTIDDLVDEAESKFREGLNAVASALNDSDYLLGDRFSAADIMMGYSIAITEQLLGTDYPALVDYLGRLKERDAFKRVAALEKN
jgi:glutathione S-transferase